MKRIFALLINGLVAFLAIRYALISNQPLLEIVIVIASIAILHLVFILGMRKFSSKTMRWLRPTTTVANTLLLMILLPMAFLVLSSAESGTGTEPSADIIKMTVGLGFILILIVYNYSIVRGR